MTISSDVLADRFMTEFSDCAPKAAMLQIGDTLKVIGVALNRRNSDGCVVAEVVVENQDNTYVLIVDQCLFDPESKIYPTEISTPDLLGLTLEEVQTRMQRAGISVSTESK